MPKSLKWARDLRAELAAEIELMESGVLQIKRGETDITADRLNALRERREEIEDMIHAFPRETIPARLCL